MFKVGSGHYINCAGQGCMSREKCGRYMNRAPGGMWASFDLEHLALDDAKTPCPNQTLVKMEVKSAAA